MFLRVVLFIVLAYFLVGIGVVIHRKTLGWLFRINNEIKEENEKGKEICKGCEGCGGYVRHKVVDKIIAPFAFGFFFLLYFVPSVIFWPLLCIDEEKWFEIIEKWSKNTMKQ